MTPKNPKLEGSPIVDCIPQIGLCPNDCPECYYNLPGFYTTKEHPVIPTLHEACNKLVRVNSGHDSNLQKKLVLKTTAKYKHKFFNTAIPAFKKLTPAVFTCNGTFTDTGYWAETKNLKNIMMVRFRTNPWNIDLMEEAAYYYADDHYIPFTLTFMRYSKQTAIPEKFWNKYEYHTHIINPYWTLKPKEQARILNIGQTISDELVGMCGSPVSSYCKDCGRCLGCYEEWWYSNHKGVIKWDRT